MGKAVTLQDLALACGCTPSTVSRALRDDPRISNAVRTRIRSMAEHLGYRANVAARHLVTGRSRTVWLLSNGLESPTNQLATVAACTTCLTLGYDCLVGAHQGQAAVHSRLVERLHQGTCDGAFILADTLDTQSPALEKLALSGFPLVFIDRYVASLPIPAVTSANFKAAKALCLACAQDSKFELFVDCFGHYNPVSIARSKGAHAAAKALGIPIVMREAYKDDGRAVAVVGSTQSVISEVTSKNLHVMGVFDFWVGSTKPGVSVWLQGQNFSSMGERAAQLLTQLIEGPRNPTHTPPLLIPCPPPRKIM